MGSSKLVSRSKKTAGSTTKPAKPLARVAVDYPQENDAVILGPYTVRISANTAGAVEVAVNGGEWTACRESCGYFWFDWEPVQTGKQKLVARLRPENGKPVLSSVRVFTIIGSSAN